MRADDENRLTGVVGLPGDLNPYRDTLGMRTAIAGAILPSRGKYNIVFDSPSRRKAGKFTFRFWVNDVTPPTVKLRGYSNGVVTARASATPERASIRTRSRRSSTAPAPRAT